MDADLFLIHRMRDGDETAIDTFVRKYYPSILRYCHYHTWDKQRAEDLAQETFERFFRSFSKYSHFGKIQNYLFTIAGNLCRDSYRVVKWSGQAEFKEQTEDPMIHLEHSLDIRKAINELPEELREVVILHYFVGLKQREIASAVGIGLPLVKYRLKCAKEMLRRKLGEEGQA